MSARPGTPSTPISVRGVERRESVVPPPFQGRAHRHRLGVARHDRDDATGRGAPAQLVDHRLRLLEVPEHAMTQHGGEASAVHRLVGVLAVGLHERHPSPGLAGQPLGVAAAPCPASPPTGRATSRRIRLGPAGTIDGPRRRRRRARAPAAPAGAPAAAGATRRCAPAPSPRHRRHRRTGQPNRPRCHRSPRQDRTAFVSASAGRRYAAIRMCCCPRIRSRASRGWSTFRGRVCRGPGEQADGAYM